jgi:hypothetical protein
MSEVNLKPFNPETGKVMDTISGKFTQKQIIQNFFGLRDTVVIAEDGKTILEIFDEFREPDILIQKWVAWNEKLAQLGVQKEYFDNLLGKYLAYGKKDSTESNGTTDAVSWVVNSEKPTRGRKKRVAE